MGGYPAGGRVPDTTTHIPSGPDPPRQCTVFRYDTKICVVPRSVQDGGQPDKRSPPTLPPDLRLFGLSLCRRRSRPSWGNHQRRPPRAQSLTAEANQQARNHSNSETSHERLFNGARSRDRELVPHSARPTTPTATGHPHISQRQPENYYSQQPTTTTQNGVTQQPFPATRNMHYPKCDARFRCC